MDDDLAICGCFGLVLGPGLVLWKGSLFCLFILFVCWDWVGLRQFFFLLVLPSSCFSGQPYFLLSLILVPLPLSSMCSSFHPSPPFHPHDQPFHLLPPSFLFSAFPPSVANPSDVLRVSASSVHTHTHTHAVIALCCHSIMWASSNQSGTCLLPNICLCCLSQSEWRLVLVPVSTCCCCFVCFLFCLRERKCVFPARGGSWINSALSAFIPTAQLITAAEGYTAARLTAQLTAALVYIGRLQWRARGGDCFLFLCGEGGRREKER